MEAGEYEVCTLLSLCARKAGVFLVNLASKEPPGDAQSETIQAPMADLGTRLFALSSFLADPTSPIGPAIDKDAENVLLHLRQVFMARSLPTFLYLGTVAGAELIAVLLHLAASRC